MKNDIRRILFIDRKLKQLCKNNNKSLLETNKTSISNGIKNSFDNNNINFAKKIMNILKEVYNSESVYLCTMCDGPMNHFHIQLIPRYSYEKRGSKNFVKPRKEYAEDKEKIELIKQKINNNVL